MRIDNFIRFCGNIKALEDMRVVSVAIRPLISDCTGAIYFTNLQLQEGGRRVLFIQVTKRPKQLHIN